MHVHWSASLFLLCTGMAAQSSAPACPADRPVDEIIAELHKQQSKRKHRQSNPLPQVTCIGAWCVDHSQTPPTIPEPAPQVERPQGRYKSEGGAHPGTSPGDACVDATRAALAAAHNVEVGDYYFETRNYSASSLRYNDALEQKPADPAIHLRLGRALEMLNRFPQAIEHYKEVPRLAGSEKWSAEARAAVLRLEHLPGP